MRTGAVRSRRRVVLYDGPDPIDVFVGMRMRKRRLQNGLTQAVVAARVGVTLQSVQKYEIARHRISASMLYRLSRALGVSPGYFFMGYGDPSAPKNLSRTPKYGRNKSTD
jgi:transcriptional regulator with XRE-family HTH domain